MYDATANFYDGLGPKKDMPPLFIPLDKAREHGELRATINEYVEESLARFVTGDLSLDDEWDAYLAELDKMGLETYLEIVQDAYKKQY
jgi:putative aldouronate transport system substrate-binding protein